MNKVTSNIEDVHTKKSIKKRLHKTKRIFLGIFIGILFFVITARLVDPSGSYSGKVLGATELQKYLFSFVTIYALLTLVLSGILFYIKRFRLSSMVVLLFLLLGSFGSVAILVYDTPSLVRYDTLSKATSCVALVITPDGYGTGFSTDKGYLVTNYHVIEGAKSLNIHYSKDTVPIIAGFSKELDIAVLKISEDIPVCRWADSSNIKAGSELYAVGWPYNPYGAPTVTKGIYSRTISADIATKALGLLNSEYIQTDTVINPGNSGGPLSSDMGIIGINTSKLSSTNNSTTPEGIGYAISSNWAKSFVDSTVSSYSKK